MLAELRRRNPAAAAPYCDLAADPNKTDILVKHILELFNSTGLTAQQAKDVLMHSKSWSKSESVGARENDALTMETVYAYRYAAP